MLGATSFTRVLEEAKATDFRIDVSWLEDNGPRIQSQRNEKCVFRFDTKHTSFIVLMAIQAKRFKVNFVHTSALDKGSIINLKRDNEDYTLTVPLGASFDGYKVTSDNYLEVANK